MQQKQLFDEPPRPVSVWEWHVEDLTDEDDEGEFDGRDHNGPERDDDESEFRIAW